MINLTAFVALHPWIFDIVSDINNQTKGNTAPDPSIYYTFGDWLQREDIFRSVWMSFLGMIVKGIYNLTHGIEQAFNFVFKLTGFTTFSQLSNLQKWFVGIGLALLATTMLLFALEMITGRRLQIHSMLINVAVVLGVVVVLPQAMGILNQFTDTATTEISNIKTANDGKGNTENTTKKSTNSMALQVVRNNVVDVGTLARNSFKQTPNDMIKSGKALNGITDQNINGLDFGTMIKDGHGDGSGNFTGDYTNFNVKKNGDGTTYNAGDVLLYGLNSTPQDNNKWKNNVQKIASSHWVFKNADTGYQRYVFMVFPILIQSLVLICLFILSGIKVVKLIFELAIMRVLAVLTAFSSLKSSARVKELVSTIFWSYMSIVMQLAMIKIFMIFINYGSATTLGSSLNIGEKGFVIIILYIGAFYGVFAGSGYINKLSGVQSGMGNETQQMLGTIGAAAMLGAASKGVGSMLGGKSSATSTPMTGDTNPNLQAAAGGSNLGSPVMETPTTSATTNTSSNTGTSSTSTGTSSTSQTDTSATNSSTGTNSNSTSVANSGGVNETTSNQGAGDTTVSPNGGVGDSGGVTELQTETGTTTESPNGTPGDLSNVSSGDAPVNNVSSVTEPNNTLEAHNQQQQSISTNQGAGSGGENAGMNPGLNQVDNSANPDALSPETNPNYGSNMEGLNAANESQQGQINQGGTNAGVTQGTNGRDGNMSSANVSGDQAQINQGIGDQTGQAGQNGQNGSSALGTNSPSQGQEMPTQPLGKESTGQGDSNKTEYDTNNLYNTNYGNGSGSSSQSAGNVDYGGQNNLGGDNYSNDGDNLQAATTPESQAKAGINKAYQDFQQSLSTDPILNGKNPEDNVDDYL